MDDDAEYYSDGWQYLTAKEREEAQAVINHRYSEMLDKINTATLPATTEHQK